MITKNKIKQDNLALRRLVNNLNIPIKRLFSGSHFSINPKAKEILRDEKSLLETRKINGHSYRFLLNRKFVTFTDLEKDLFHEIVLAFSILYKTFDGAGYHAHFRSAVTESIIDIGISRYFRENQIDLLGPFQNLISILQRLSFERYEGSAATTGFFITKKSMASLTNSIKKFGLDISTLMGKSYTVSDELFAGPLSYRYVDGSHSLYLAEVGTSYPFIKINNILLKSKKAEVDGVDILSHKELFNLIDPNGKENIAAILNSKSEIEILTGDRKIILWRKGNWSIFDPSIFHDFLKDILMSESLRDALIWTVYSISKIRHGTLILIGDINETTVNSIKKGSVAGDHNLSNDLIGLFAKKSICDLKSSNELMRILTSDGLTIVNCAGKIIDTGIITDTSKIRNGSATGGGRTTAAIAASNHGKVIKVSEDGPISLYHDEKLIYKFG